MVQFQPVHGQPFLRILQVLPRFAFVLKPNDGVVGITNDEHVAVSFLPPLVCPLIEHVMQVHVR